MHFDDLELMHFDVDDISITIMNYTGAIWDQKNRSEKLDVLSRCARNALRTGFTCFYTFLHVFTCSLRFGGGECIKSGLPIFGESRDSAHFRNAHIFHNSQGLSRPVSEPSPRKLDRAPIPRLLCGLLSFAGNKWLSFARKKIISRPKSPGHIRTSKANSRAICMGIIKSSTQTDIIPT